MMAVYYFVKKKYGYFRLKFRGIIYGQCKSIQ